MRKTVILIIMLLWTTVATTTASPIFNDGSYVPIQLNGSNESYGEYVNSGDWVVTMPGNNEGSHFNSLNTYMGTNYGVTLIPVSDIVYGPGCTGIWETTDTIDFYAVKAGPNFALYLVDPADNHGSWSTYDLWLGSNGDSLEVSHLTGYHASPVPIPTSVLLFGTGLLGIIGIKRKRLL